MEQAKKSPNASAQSNAETSAVEKPVEKSGRGYFWFVAHGALLKGPYSTTELQKLINKKEVSEKFFAWRDGYREWRPLYGIEEFKSEKQGEDLGYPSVPVPGAPVAFTASSEHLVTKHVPVYKVRFNRSRWSDLKKTEVVFLFLASLVFTMAILTLAFNVFENEWNKVWGRRASGILYTVGNVKESLPFYLIAPIQSAPGLQHQETHYIALDMEADMNRKDTSEFAGFKIKSESSKETYENMAWDKSNTYSRRMRVQGYIDLKNPAMIHIANPGSAFEPVQSTRLTEGFAHP